MNTASLRRRGYSKKQEEGIVLPAGYTLGEYWNVTSHTYVPLNINGPFDFEVEVEPSNVSDNNGSYIIGAPAGHIWAIHKGKAQAQSGDSTDTFFEVGKRVKISGHNPKGYGDLSYRYYVDGVDTGLRAERSNQLVSIMAGTQYAYEFKGKFFPLKIWRNGELIKHYVPCTDGQGNSYMYEVVEGVFITPNSGTLVVK